MSFKFECPYCGESFEDPDDIEHVQSYSTCPGCDANYDEEELEDLLPDEDLQDEPIYGSDDDDDDDDLDRRADPDDPDDSDDDDDSDDSDEPDDDDDDVDSYDDDAGYGDDDENEESY